MQGRLNTGNVGEWKAKRTLGCSVPGLGVLAGKPRIYSKFEKVDCKEEASAEDLFIQCVYICWCRTVAEESYG